MASAFRGQCSVSYTPSAVGSGSPSITASYGGDPAHASSSDNTTVTVVGHPTDTSVSCSPGTVNVEQPSTCTATVTDEVSSGPPTTPTGTVSFFPGGPGSFSDTSPCTLSGTGASATCSATFTPSGPEAGGNTTIFASYSGDSVHLVSSGNTTVTVKPSSKAACAGRVARIVGRARGDRLVGTRASDVIVGGSRNDRVHARGGGDLVCAGAGSDRVLGGGGSDRLFGQVGNDVLFGTLRRRVSARSPALSAPTA
jgi:Ca2+-binding RTX toxin-like protein